jgi:hypothetical protein
MFTKPCERSNRGCEGLAHAKTRKNLARRRFCGMRCSYLHRVEIGRQPTWNLTAEQRSEAGRRGGTSGAVRRRKAAVLAAASHVNGLMPQWLRARLTERETGLITAMLVRSWEMGHKRGLYCERKRQQAIELRAFLKQARKPKEAA